MNEEQVKHGFSDSLGRLLASINTRLVNVSPESTEVVWSRMFDLDERNLNPGQTANEVILEALPRFAWHAFRTIVKRGSCPSVIKVSVQSRRLPEGIQYTLLVLAPVMI